MTTDSGLKYSVLSPGKDGGKCPKMGDSVKVHYVGWLENGSVFDSSRQRNQPSEFKLGQVIGGWNEGLQLMTPGAKFKFTIPYKLAYGEAGRPPKIPAKATLIFEVELLSFVEGVPLPELKALDRQKATTTESGLVYEVENAGTGETAGAGDLQIYRFAAWIAENKQLAMCSELRNGRRLAGTTAKMDYKFLKELAAIAKVGSVLWVEVPPEQLADGPPNPARPNPKTIWRLECEDVIPFARNPKNEVRKTASGLEYEIIKEGTGKIPNGADRVTVNYAGWLKDGSSFDSSFSRREPSSFQVGGVIKGWTEGLQLMKEGAVYRFTIPWALAYGEQGSRSIPPKSDLIFLVELQKVN